MKFNFCFCFLLQICGKVILLDDNNVLDEKRKRNRIDK